jgi:hypothetical protein
MQTFLAMVDRMGYTDSDPFLLSGARIALLKDGNVYTYLPNTRTWVPNESVERDYFDHYPELRYKVLPKYLAQFLESAMKDVSSVVVRITLEEAGKSALDPIAPISGPQPRRALFRHRTHLVRWARENSVELPAINRQRANKATVSLKPEDLAFLARVTSRSSLHRSRLRRGTSAHDIVYKPVVYDLIRSDPSMGLKKNPLGVHSKSKSKKQKTELMWGPADRDID